MVLFKPVKTWSPLIYSTWHFITVGQEIQIPYRQQGVKEAYKIKERLLQDEMQDKMDCGQVDWGTVRDMEMMRPSLSSQGAAENETLTRSTFFTLCICITWGYTDISISHAISQGEQTVRNLTESRALLRKFQWQENDPKTGPTRCLLLETVIIYFNRFIVHFIRLTLELKHRSDRICLKYVGEVKRSITCCKMWCDGKYKMKI